MYVSPNFTYNTTLNAQYNIKTFLNAIDWDTIESNRLIELKPLLDQESDINLYVKYVTSVLNKNDKTLSSVLIDIWNRLESNVLKFPLFVHEKNIKIHPVVFEKTVLFALLFSDTKNLIHMCSKSPLVFQACTSILNEMLIKLNFTNHFLVFLIDFIDRVRIQCKNNSTDLIDLYPIRCRSILILRSIKNISSSLVSNDDLCTKVKWLALNYPKECMCLLIHFPDLWIPS